MSATKYNNILIPTKLYLKKNFSKFVYMKPSNSFRNIMKTAFVFFWCINIISFAKAKEPVSIQIENLRSAKGQVIIQVFTNETNFKADKPMQTAKFPKRSVREGKMTIHLKLSPGVYGIALLDDENSNDKMDNNMLGIPKEGFGFANYYHSGMSRPKFNNFRVTITESPSPLTIRVRYL